jgi:hypothetical protein
VAFTVPNIRGNLSYSYTVKEEEDIFIEYVKTPQNGGLAASIRPWLPPPSSQPPPAFMRRPLRNYIDLIKLEKEAKEEMCRRHLLNGYLRLLYTVETIFLLNYSGNFFLLD